MTAVDRMLERAAGIGEWLADNAPYCNADQKHLDENTVERAYWHYGYRAALLDAIRLINKMEWPEPGK